MGGRDSRRANSGGAVLKKIEKTFRTYQHLESVLYNVYWLLFGIGLSKMFFLAPAFVALVTSFFFWKRAQALKVAVDKRAEPFEELEYRARRVKFHVQAQQRATLKELYLQERFNIALQNLVDASTALPDEE